MDDQAAESTPSFQNFQNFSINLEFFSSVDSKMEMEMEMESNFLQNTSDNNLKFPGIEVLLFETMGYYKQFSSRTKHDKTKDFPFL